MKPAPPVTRTLIAVPPRGIRCTAAHRTDGSTGGPAATADHPPAARPPDRHRAARGPRPRRAGAGTVVATGAAAWPDTPWAARAARGRGARGRPGGPAAQTPWSGPR